METLLQQVVNGLVVGSVYALIALGYTMVYGILGLINFAHGDVLMVGALVSWTVVTALAGSGLPGWLILLLSVPVAIVVCCVLNYAIEKVAYRPLRNAPRLAPLITAIGMSLLLQTLAMIIWKPNPKPFPRLLPAGAWEFGDFTLRHDSAILLVIGVGAIAGVHLLIQRTRLGLAVRAVAQDAETAAAMGIPFRRTVLATFALGSGLAALAGVVNGLYYSEVSFNMGLLLGAIGFSAAVIGGLGNVYGAILGGFIFAALQTLGAVALPFASAYKDVFAFGAVIVLMAIKPGGLLAERSAERV